MAVRARRPNVFAKTGRQGTFKFFPSKKNTPPPGWLGTLSEYWVYRELVVTHKMKEGEDFSYQTNLSTTGGLPGRLELGGLIADFIINDRSMVINPLSDFYHYSDPGTIAREIENRNLLQRQGMTVIWIDSGDLEKNARYYVTEALSGRDHSRLARGLY